PVLSPLSLRDARPIFPVFANSVMRGGWTGVYMMSPDSHPIIGAMPDIPGLYVMTGDSGSSFKTAPATGVCLAELMTEGRSTLVRSEEHTSELQSRENL